MEHLIALYPGQGSQRQGMAIDLYHASKQVKLLFNLAGENLYGLLCEGDEKALQLKAQFVVALASRAATIRLEEYGITPSVHAGFSLGELTAYCSAGIFDDETLFRIIKVRDELTSLVRRCHPDLATVAVIGFTYEEMQTILEGEELYIANDNAPNQVVVTGNKERLFEVLNAKKAKRIIPLRISGPFHTPFMAEVQNQFEDALKKLDFHNPKTAVLSSVTGRLVTDFRHARQNLVTQLTNPVRWTAVIEAIKQTEGAIVAELGYSTVLAGLCKSNGLNLPCPSLGEEQTIKEFAEERSR